MEVGVGVDGDEGGKSAGEEALELKLAFKTEWVDCQGENVDFCEKRDVKLFTATGIGGQPLERGAHFRLFTQSGLCHPRKRKRANARHVASSSQI